jgi:hypothetical protein
MEGEGSDSVGMGIIVLYETLGAYVPDFYGLVVRGRGDTGAIGMETNSVDLGLVVGVGVDEVLLGDVPELNRLVI